MRTTVDLPEDLHRIAASLARDTGRSLSATVTDLVRRGLDAPSSGATVKRRNGFPVVSVGRTLTTDDVRRLDDE